MKIFKEWLVLYQESKAVCIACNELIRCCKTNLIQHSQIVKHIENINLKESIDNKLIELSR